MRTRSLTIAVIVAVVVAFAACAWASDGTDLLSGDTEGLLTIKNLGQLYRTLGIDELRNERPDDFRFLSEELIEDVGIDLLDPDALEAEGFDLGRPLHVGVMVEPPAVLVLVPGKGQALKWLRAKMEEQGVVFTRQARFGGVEVDGGEADEVACFQRRDYVGIVITDHDEGGGSAVETVGKLIEHNDGPSFIESESYQRTMKRLPAEADVTMYMGPELRRNMSHWGKSDEELAEYGLTNDDMRSWERDLGLEKSASAMAMTVAPDRVRIDGYSWLGKDSRARDWLVVDNNPVAFLRRTPSQPWLVGMFRLDFGALWDAMQPILERARKGDDDKSVKDTFAEVKEETGIDVEADLIQQLCGNMGILVSRAALMGSDLVLMAQVKDPDRFQKTVATATSLAREDIEKKAAENQNQPQTQIEEETVGGATVYHVSMPPMAELMYGMIDDHFVAATLPLRFRDIAGSSRDSFIDSIGNDDVKAALTDPSGSAFYIDFRALSRDAEGILPMMGPKGAGISRVFAELSELVATSRFDGEGIIQASTLSSTRPGIWKFLIGLLIDRVEPVE
jgi:hypothetical protein